MPQTPPRGRNNAGVKHKLLSYWNLISNSNRQLVRMIPPHSKVLDMGCSDGQMGRCLREEKGCIVWGMEMDPRRADKAKPVLDRVIVGDAMDSRTWESIHARFDVIALADVLEHMDNPRGFLSALVPWLEPNGVIVLSLPNAGHWSVRRALAGNDSTIATAVLAPPAW